ncbi:MAG: Sapep family Mn(2+)-dependent dipeptidase [bacterium]
MNNEINDYINRNQQQIVNHLVDLIKVPSVNGESSEEAPFGKDIQRCLQLAIQISKQLGLNTFINKGYYGWAEIGQGKPLGVILVHLDVVPAGENWDYPPFEGKMVGDKIYGRGTEDDKGPAIASIHALAAIKHSSIKINGRLRIIFGTNEELGWGGVDYYREHDQLPDYGITPDAQFPLIYAEKEIIRILIQIETDSSLLISMQGGAAVNMVPDQAQAVLAKQSSLVEKINNIKALQKNEVDICLDKNEIKISTRGKSAHGSTPEEGVNAITKLNEILINLIDPQDPGYQIIEFYQNFLANDPGGKKLNIAHENFSGKLTINPGILKFTPPHYQVELDIRSPVGIDPSIILSEINSRLPSGFNATIQRGVPGLHVDRDSVLVKSLLNTYREITGDHSPPLAIGGGTYARAFKNTVAFGSSFPGQPKLAHQKNEFIKIENLIKLTNIIAQAVVNLDQQFKQK